MTNAKVPQGCKATAYFIVKDATGTPPSFDTTKKLAFGLVNINGAPAKVLACLPGMSAFADANAKAALLAGKTYETAGQIAMFLDNPPGVAYGTTDATAYHVAPDGSDDGLSWASGEAVVGDLTKRLSAYAWMSNHITVRSDVFVVYMKVQLTVGATVTAQNYVGVIDRSMVKAATDKPVVLMFSPLN